MHKKTETKIISFYYYKKMWTQRGGCIYAPALQLIRIKLNSNNNI